jgi:hypothetical protein
LISYTSVALLVQKKSVADLCSVAGDGDEEKEDGKQAEGNHKLPPVSAKHIANR